MFENGKRRWRVANDNKHANVGRRPQDRYALCDWSLNRHLRRRHRRRQGPGWSQVSRDESLLHACLQWLSRSCDSYPLTAASCLYSSSFSSASSDSSLATTVRARVCVCTYTCDSLAYIPDMYVYISPYILSTLPVPLPFSLSAGI